MATRYVDFSGENGGDDANPSGTEGAPWKSFANIVSGDTVKYFGGDWTLTSADKETVSGLTGITMEPVLAGDRLRIAMADQVLTSWTQIDPISVDGQDVLDAAFNPGTGGLYYTANPNTTGGNNGRQGICFPGTFTPFFESLTDANAFGGENFIANYRKGVGKYRRNNYIGTSGAANTDSTADDFPTEEGQWTIGDGGLFIYTGSSTEDPYDAFGDIWFALPEAPWMFSDCDIDIDASEIEFLYGGHAWDIRTTAGGGGVRTVTVDGGTYRNMYKVGFTSGNAAAPIRSTFRNMFAEYLDHTMFNLKFSHSNAVIENNTAQYVALGDPVGGLVYTSAISASDEQTIIQDNEVSFVPYGNTWADGFGYYVENPAMYNIVQRNVANWCKSGYHMGGSVGGLNIARFNLALDCGQLGRFVDGKPSNANVTTFTNNVGLRIDQASHMVWLFQAGDPTEAGAIDIQSSIDPAESHDIKIHNNIVQVKDGVASTGLNGIRINDAGVTWTESHNIINGFEIAVKEAGSSIALGTGTTTTTQAFVVDDLIDGAPAEDGGVALAGVNDGDVRDRVALPQWPGSPEIGSRTYYPSFSSGRGRLVAVEDPPVVLPDVKIGVSQHSLNTSTGVQTFTNANLGGKTPKGALAFMTNATVANTIAPDAMLSTGFTDGVSNRQVGLFSEDNKAAPANAAHMLSAANMIATLDASTISSAAAFDSFSADSTAVNFSNAAPDAYLASLVQFAGDDVKAEAGTVSVATTQDASVTVSLTDNSLEPDLILFLLSTGATDTRSTYGPASVGFASNESGGIGNYCVVRNDASLSPTSLSAVVSNNRCAGVILHSGGVLKQYEVTRIAAGEFDLTTRDSADATARDVYFLALSFGGAKVKAGTIETPTDAGVDWNVTGVGFKPQFVLSLWTVITGAYNTVRTNAEASMLSMYAFTDSEEASVCISSRDDVPTTATASNSSPSMRNFLRLGSDIDYCVLSNPQMTADGWTVAAADIDAVNAARQGIYVAVEDVSE